MLGGLSQTRKTWAEKKRLKTVRMPSVPVNELNRRVDLDNLISGNVPARICELYAKFCKSCGRGIFDRKAARAFAKKHPMYFPKSKKTKV
jgi:ornithine cyclodeaminase/alanine dehydrogenase-like protein (mu-crystallin family)